MAAIGVTAAPNSPAFLVTFLSGVGRTQTNNQRRGGSAPPEIQQIRQIGGSDRSGQGNVTTHWRMGMRGSTGSTRWAAVSTIRRTPHEGQNPLLLLLRQLKGTKCS